MATTGELAIRPTLLRNRAIPWPWVIGALAAVTGLLMVLVIFHLQSFVDGDIDPYGFGDMGRSIAHGHWFEGFGSLIKRRAPLYPTVIGGVFLIFGDSDRLVFGLHVAYFVATCMLVYAIARRLFNQRTAIIAGVICAFNPMLLRYLPSLHLETQLTFLITLLVWLMVRFYEKPTVARGALVGLVGGLAALTKAVAAPIPVLFAIGIVLAVRSARKRGESATVPWKPLLAIVAVMACSIAPWTIRNYRATGHFVPISSGTSDAFLRGFIFTQTDYITLRKPPYTDAENASNAYFRSLAAAKGTEWQKDDYETDQILNEEAKRRLIHEPGAVLRKTVIGIFTFWYQMTSLTNSLLAAIVAGISWILAFIGWRRARREHKPSWLILLPILYLNLSLAVLLALGRYSVPVLPILTVLTAYGIDSLLQRRTAAAHA
jgi:4-amino-4-deoxy-L-arabinose transferase-like glycosyltransferase